MTHHYRDKKYLGKLELAGILKPVEKAEQLVEATKDYVDQDHNRTRPAPEIWPHELDCDGAEKRDKKPPAPTTQKTEIDPMLTNAKREVRLVVEETDMVNHPPHYTSHPSGVECIEITRHYNFDIGNAIKYLWRNGLKSESGMTSVTKQIEDLEKAVFYINDEIKRLRG